MKPSQILHRFVTKSGKDVVLRAPEWGDLDDLLELINSIVDEGADIKIDERKTREEEIDWLSGVMARMEKGKAIPMVAEVDGKVVASSEIMRGGFRCESHLGNLGIIIMAGYRDVGIGTEMMKALLEQARTMGLKAVTLSAFSTNRRAIHVYEKVGFVETGSDSMMSPYSAPDLLVTTDP